MSEVCIVEDNEKIRTLIQKFLDRQENMTCNRVFDNVEAFMQDLKTKPHPNIVLMDIDLPGMNGIEGMKLIKSQYPHIEIIMLTIYHDSHKIFDSLCAGASGYLLKHTSLPEIKESIDVVLNGGSVMSPQIARKVIGYFSHTNSAQVKATEEKPIDSKVANENDLTFREREIVIGLVDGLSYKMIADRMDISLDTVRAHIRNIYRKLHVNSKAEVIAKSLRGEI